MSAFLKICDPVLRNWSITAGLASEAEVEVSFHSVQKFVTYFSHGHLLTNRKYYHDQEVSFSNGRKRNDYGFVANTG